jgi:hypothetical protein
MNHLSRTQPSDGPRGTPTRHEDSAPRSRFPVHRILRRGLLRREHPDLEESTGSTPGPSAKHSSAASLVTTRTQEQTSTENMFFQILGSIAEFSVISTRRAVEVPSLGAAA